MDERRRRDAGGALMAFIVNSSPGAGLRFEASVTLADAQSALEHAVALSRRGRRLIKIRDTESGEIYDERAFRARLTAAAKELHARAREVEAE